MAISGKDLISMTQEEINALFSKSDRCAICGSYEMPHPDEGRIILGVPANPNICDDCHYEAVGEWIEGLMGEDNSYINN